MHVVGQARRVGRRRTFARPLAPTTPFSRAHICVRVPHHKATGAHKDVRATQSNHRAPSSTTTAPQVRRPPQRHPNWAAGDRFMQRRESSGAKGAVQPALGPASRASRAPLLLLCSRSWPERSRSPPLTSFPRRPPLARSQRKMDVFCHSGLVSAQALTLAAYAVVTAGAGDPRRGVRGTQRAQRGRGRAAPGIATTQQVCCPLYVLCCSCVPQRCCSKRPTRSRSLTASTPRSWRPPRPCTTTCSRAPRE